MIDIFVKNKKWKTYKYTQRPSMKSRGIPTFGLFSEQFELFANNLLQQFLNDKFGGKKKKLSKYFCYMCV